jgi:polynucleotide 5'-hydroxyl-kinase GRC3/NOL9
VLHSSVPPSRLYYALNGGVVGLCCSPPSQPLGTPPQAQPPALPCLGLGIVRAADAAARRLFILTAVPEAELESVSVLQLGRLELPASLLQTAAHLSPYLCLHSLSSMGTGAGAIKSRNNLLRQGQL